jgi:hypothetical protein
MKQKRRLTALALAGTTAALIGIGGAGTAQAASDSAHLSIRYVGGSQYSNYSLTVSGHVNLPQAVPTNYTIKILGEDSWFDDTPVCEAWPLKTDANGNFWHQYRCSGALLNEDWGGDENYAKVTVFPAGGKSRTIRSNTVTGSY